MTQEEERREEEGTGGSWLRVSSGWKNKKSREEHVGYCCLFQVSDHESVFFGSSNVCRVKVHTGVDWGRGERHEEREEEEGEV